MIKDMYDNVVESVMIDYHIHPNYSFDAQGSIEEFCEVAIQKGMREIAFTTHVDTDPATNDCFIRVKGEAIDVQSDKWIEDYESTIRSAGQKYAEDGLIVLMGAELDIYPGVCSNLPERFLSTDWDLIIGSMHLIDHLALSKKEDAELIYSRYDLEDLGQLYFSILEETIETSLVNVLGHLDLYRRYGEECFGESINEVWKPHIDTLARRMKKYNVGFEINTSSWRKGQLEPHPSKELIHNLVARGVDVITVGSDAHHPDIIGDGIEKAIALLHNCCSEIPTVFRHGKTHGKYVSPTAER